MYNNTSTIATYDDPNNHLPAGWVRTIDPNSGQYYYANQQTGESSWYPPVAPAIVPVHAVPPQLPLPITSQQLQQQQQQQQPANHHQYFVETNQSQNYFQPPQPLNLPIPPTSVQSSNYQYNVNTHHLSQQQQQQQQEPQNQTSVYNNFNTYQSTPYKNHYSVQDPSQNYSTPIQPFVTTQNVVSTSSTSQQQSSSWNKWIRPENNVGQATNTISSLNLNPTSITFGSPVAATASIPIHNTISTTQQQILPLSSSFESSTISGSMLLSPNNSSFNTSYPVTTVSSASQHTPLSLSTVPTTTTVGGGDVSYPVLHARNLMDQLKTLDESTATTTTTTTTATDSSNIDNPTEATNSIGNVKMTLNKKIELSSFSAGQVADLCIIQIEKLVEDQEKLKQQEEEVEQNSTSKNSVDASVNIYYEPIDPSRLNIQSKRDFMEQGRLETRLHALYSKLKQI